MKKDNMLNESTIRRFMKLATIDGLTDKFVAESLEEANDDAGEELEEGAPEETVEEASEELDEMGEMPKSQPQRQVEWFPLIS